MCRLESVTVCPSVRVELVSGAGHWICPEPGSVVLENGRGAKVVGIVVADWTVGEAARVGVRAGLIDKGDEVTVGLTWGVAQATNKRQSRNGKSLLFIAFALKS
jgi:hypothetical protein